MAILQMTGPPEKKNGSVSNITWSKTKENKEKVINNWSLNNVAFNIIKIACDIKVYCFSVNTFQSIYVINR